MTIHRGVQRALVGAGLSAALLSPAWSVDLLSGFGGDAGFGQLAMLANDDGSSSQLNLPFAINFFGNSFDKFFINNNGNITFQSALSVFTPNAFPVSNQPMIAPWWADVDTRGTGLPAGHNAVYVAAPNSDTVVITWHDVGYFSSRTDKTNSFQLVLRNRADTGAGNFDFDFRYKQLQWTTGRASGGTDGLGGTPAQAGYDNGLGNNYYTLPGSRTADVLNLVNLSNVSPDQAGLWTFAVRNGDTPGSSASNPLMPVVINGSYVFNFNVQLNQRVFIDPDVAVGYDYVLTNASSPSFQSVVLPNVGDGIYDLYLWSDGSQSWVDSGLDLQAGQTYDFGAGGVRRFSIRGIETSANIDPANTQAFVTGLTFTGPGLVSMTQTPITQAVPEPGTYALMVAGIAALFLQSRRRRVQ